MKKFFLLALISTNLMAGERVLLADSKVTDVELNTKSVRCSLIGYGLEELKVNIKGLDGWTIFDHSNIRAGDVLGSPCMTAGACRPGNDIDDILAGGTRTERMRVDRQIIEIKYLGKDVDGNNVCHRYIEERLQTAVNRGDRKGVIPFYHTRAGNNETFPVSVCN